MNLKEKGRGEKNTFVPKKASFSHTVGGERIEGSKIERRNSVEGRKRGVRERGEQEKPKGGKKKDASGPSIRKKKWGGSMYRKGILGGRKCRGCFFQEWGNKESVGLVGFFKKFQESLPRDTKNNEKKNRSTPAHVTQVLTMVQMEFEEGWNSKSTKELTFI